MSGSNQHCVGIDVSKGTLDIAIGSNASLFTVPNDTGGFSKILKELKRNCTLLILIEATGGLGSESSTEVGSIHQRLRSV